MRILLATLLLTSCATTNHSMTSMCLPKDSKSPATVHYIAGTTHMFCWEISKIRPKKIRWRSTSNNKGREICKEDETRYIIDITCENF